MSKNSKAKTKKSSKQLELDSEIETPLADAALDAIQNEEAPAEVEAHEEEELHADAADHATDETAAEHEEKEREKFKLEFYGSDILRMQAPEVMKIADTVADEWVNDGNFNDIPLPVPPVAQALVAQGLRKAKEVEKKLDEKGVFLMARMGVDYLKSKIKK